MVNFSWIRTVGNILHDKENKPAYLTGILNDITVQKQVDIRQNDFIAMASHELRTPLTTIKAYMQLLTAKALKNQDDFMASAMEKVSIQVKKMNGMINGFLNASSFEAGEIHLDLQRFEITALLKEIVEESELTSPTHTMKLSATGTFELNADRDKIGQVVSNFISNAVKYAPGKTEIEVSCEAKSKTVAVRVRDYGMGIKDKDLGKLFKRYQRIDNIQTRKIAGFGLGLYLSAEIILLHKGKIWVESELGQGSTFCFSLPISLRDIQPWEHATTGEAVFRSIDPIVFFQTSFSREERPKFTC